MDVSLIIRLIDQVSAPAQKVGDALGSIGNKAAEGARQMSQGFGQAIREGFSTENVQKALQETETKFREARSNLTRALGLGAVFAAPVYAAGNFEASMNDIATLIDTTAESLEDMGNNVLAISGRVPVALGDLTSALYDVRSAGVDAGEAMNVLERSAQLAVAGKGSASEAVDLVTSAINAFKLEGVEAERIYDIIFKAVKNGKTTISELAQGFGDVASTIASANIEVDEHMAAVAALTTTGVSASTAHRQIQAAVAALTRDTKDARAVFGQLGADSFSDLVEKSGGMVNAFELIRDALGGNEAAIVSLFGSVQAYNGVMGLTGANNEAFREALDDMRHGSEAVMEAFHKQIDGFNSQMRLLANQMQELGVMIGAALLDPLKELLGHVRPIISAISEWSRENPELSSSIVKTGAAVAGLNIALAVLAFMAAGVRRPLVRLATLFLEFDKDGRNVSRGWRTMAGAGRSLGRALDAAKLGATGLAGLLTGLSAPAWLAIGALLAAGWALWKYWDDITSWLGGFAEPFQELFAPMVDGAIDMVDNLIGKFGEMMGIDPADMEMFKAEAWEAIGRLFDFSGVIDTAKEMLSGFWDWVGGIFSREVLSDEEKANQREAGRAFAQNIIDGAGDLFATGQQLAADLIEGIRAYIDSWIQPIRDMFKFSLEIDWPEPPGWLTWLMERGKSVADSAANLFYGEVEPALSDAAEQAYAPRYPSISGSYETGVGINVDDAARQLQEGGARAGDEFGKHANDTMVRDAAELGAIVGRAAAQEISRARVNVSGPKSSPSGLGSAISNARTGALHGGTE